MVLFLFLCIGNRGRLNSKLYSKGDAFDFQIATFSLKINLSFIKFWNLLWQQLISCNGEIVHDDNQKKLRILHFIFLDILRKWIAARWVDRVHIACYASITCHASQLGSPSLPRLYSIHPLHSDWVYRVWEETPWTAPTSGLQQRRSRQFDAW